MSRTCAAPRLSVRLPGVKGTASGPSGSVWAADCRCGRPHICPNITAVVSYYYVMPHGKPDFTGIKGPVLGHFGTADGFISVEEAKALEADIHAAGVDVKFDYYEGAGHAFFNDTNRLGTYSGCGASRSWERTVSFLRTALCSSNPLRNARDPLRSLRALRFNSHQSRNPASEAVM